MLSVHSAFAIAPVTMSGSSPALENSYNIGTSNTFIYTITNNVPNRSFPITVSGISNLITRTTVSNDCGNALPAGVSSCNIGIVIAPTSSNANTSINQTLSVNYQGRIPLTNTIAFSVPSTPPVFIAAGQDLTGAQPPLIVVSQNGGSSFSKASTTSLTTNGSLAGASCTGSGTNAICAAGGQDIATSTALLALSTNGGSTWTKITSIDLTNARIFGTGCTGSGANAICTAVGADSGSLPLLLVSQNGGSSFFQVDTSGFVSKGSFSGISCIGSGTTARCIAAGANHSDSLLVISQDGGSNWSQINTSFTNETFSGVSCTGSGGTAICAAGGGNNTTLPLLAVSQDGGSTWSQIDTSNFAGGKFLGMSCTGSGANAICIAAGAAGSVQPPLLNVSQNGGSSWSKINTSSFTTNGQFFAASCTGSGTNAVCIAAGQDLTGTTPPLLLVSQNGGSNWSQVNTTPFTTNGSFNSTSCTGSGTSAICIAAGSDTSIVTAPLLIISTDGGSTWSQITTSLPARGQFSATAVAG